jgi:hypothetical protein
VGEIDREYRTNQRNERKTYPDVQEQDKATLFLPPNVKKLDCPLAKKPRGRQPAPELYIAVNIAPTAGAGGSAMQGSYIVSECPIVQSGTSSAPAPSPPNPLLDVPAGTSSALGPMSVGPDLRRLRRCRVRESRRSLMVVLLDCTHTGRAPTLRELLTLMDDEDPMLDGSYMDAYTELSDFGVEDAIDVYALEECLLATFGCLGRMNARCLRQYARDKILIPLDLVRAASEPPTDTEEIDAPTDEGRIHDWRESLEDDEIEEVEGDGERKEVDEVVDAEEGTIDVAENEDEGDVALSDHSYEV